MNSQFIYHFNSYQKKKKSYRVFINNSSKPTPKRICKKRTLIERNSEVNGSSCCCSDRERREGSLHKLTNLSSSSSSSSSLRNLIYLGPYFSAKISDYSHLFQAQIMLTSFWARLSTPKPCHSILFLVSFLFFLFYFILFYYRPKEWGIFLRLRILCMKN